MLTVREAIESKIEAFVAALNSGEAWLETEFHLAEQHIHDFFSPPAEALVAPVQKVDAAGASSAGAPAPAPVVDPVPAPVVVAPAVADPVPAPVVVAPAPAPVTLEGVDLTAIAQVADAAPTHRYGD